MEEEEPVDDEEQDVQGGANTSIRQLKGIEEK